MSSQPRQVESKKYLITFIKRGRESTRDRDIETETERDRDTETERDRETETERERWMCKIPSNLIFSFLTGLPTQVLSPLFLESKY